MTSACRRNAPPGFRAAPRATFAVTAIRLQSLTPSRLRRCALTLASRGSAQGPSPPRDAWRPFKREPNRLTPDRPGQRPAVIGLGRRIRRGLLRQVVRMCAALDAGGSRLSHHEGWFTDTPPGLAMGLPRHASRPTPQGAAGAFSSVVGALTWPASGNESVKPSCGDAESAITPFGADRPKASLSRCESWRWRGCASGFMAATVRRKQFPLLCHCVRRIPRGTNSFRLPALHCVSTASGAASPSPAGRITTRTRWARTLFN